MNVKETLRLHKLWIAGHPEGERAFFSWKDLTGSNFTGYDLSGASFVCARLAGSNFANCNLKKANFDGAVLTAANFNWADLLDANLHDSHLKHASFVGTKNMRTCRLPDFQLPDGDLIVWKKASFRNLVKLLIPKEAKRTASIVGRKCRAEYAKVLGIYDFSGEPTKLDSINSTYRGDFIYKVGEVVYPDSYNDEPWKECTNGIHFFQTKEEAQNYIC